ncbi:hypothetical protein PAXINDRAFT_11802 [Paxillus involutus ATCC 200175]|uniref:Uncharacterized protein n=1 Tax=Paxillus involutus ATCC 200175 TaxID=664439 RepID=A0A0C9U858_PAXIN|nr:hypothetical protein PAXINDRAFT_11802 [Paxillus involutus ATCC 200175]
MTSFEGNPEPSASSPIPGDIGQAGNTEELDGSEWADSDCEGGPGDTSGTSEEEGEGLDEGLELKQIEMEDGLHDGFNSNTLGNFNAPTCQMLHQHREGKKAVRRASEQGAVVKGPSRGATDQTTSSVGRATMPSSQDDGGKDIEVHHTHVVPQTPEAIRQTASNKVVDTMNPNAMSTGLTVPVGRSHKLQTKSDENTKGNKDGEIDKGV